MVLFLFLDRQVAAVFKPAGIPTQAAEGWSENFTDQVIGEIKRKEGREKVYLHPVHRLDTPVSGIVLFARTSKALSRLQESIRNNKLQKVYAVEVEGHLSPSKGTLSHYLVHRAHRAEVVEKGEMGAKLATLSYAVVEEKEKSTLLKIDLETGRYHQIRCQLAHSGHPVVGDKKYGSKLESAVVHLCHCALQFPHPISGETIQVDLPDRLFDFGHLL